MFLPSYSTIPAVLAFWALQTNLKWLKFLILVGLILLTLNAVSQIFQTKKRNFESDKKNIAERERILSNEAWIKLIETQHPQEATQVIVKKYNQSKNDRTWLIPLAQSLLLPQNILEELSQSQDVSVVLAVSKNPRTPAKILIQIYKDHPYPDYFFSALAQNESTPPEILFSLFEERSRNSGVEISLASNTRLPMSLIEQLINSKDPLVLGELARNPQISCEFVSKVLHKLENFPENATYLSSAKGWAESGRIRCSIK